MSTTTVEVVSQETQLSGNAPAKRRDLKTQIMHADEEAYKKQLEPLGGKEDLWQGGDV